MKRMVNIFRWLVGLLFIFSGLIKANDPLGLSYKMQEFFEVWGWHFFHDYTLWFALAMNLLEVIAGVALIVGFRIKETSWLLLLLIVFFTFLTAYVLFTDKIHACGCFGDCVPLTPIQTFTKDLFLLVMIVVLLANTHKMQAYFNKKLATGIVLVLAFLVAAFQWYVLQYLPVLDCLPYAKSKNIIEQMKVPEGAVADSFTIAFTYKKQGKMVEFDQESFPDDFDSTYEFVKRVDKLVRKGNATPKIADFVLKTVEGNDTTTAILEQSQIYVMLLSKDFPANNHAVVYNEEIVRLLQSKNIPLYIVSAHPDAKNIIVPNGVKILMSDGTVIKTAARVDPTYFIMRKGQILDKFSGKVAKKKIDFWINSYQVNHP